jgi:hypothetical protein
MKQQNDEKWGAKDFAFVGALVGGAGVGNSAGLIGLSATVSLMPVCLVVGAVAGLAFWGVKKLIES